MEEIAQLLKFAVYVASLVFILSGWCFINPSLSYCCCLSPQLSRPGQVLGDEKAIKTYCGAKMTAGAYQRAKQKFVLSLQEAGLGIWNRKPPEQEHFQSSV